MLHAMIPPSSGILFIAGILPEILTFRQKYNKIDYMYEVQYGRTKD